MYAAAHIDLIRAAVDERLEGTVRRAAPIGLPAVPARITTWGPRAGRRSPDAVDARALELPRPREVDLTEAALLLDA